MTKGSIGEVRRRALKSTSGNYFQNFATYRRLQFSTEARVRADDEFVEFVLGRGFAFEKCRNNGAQESEGDADDTRILQWEQRAIGSHDARADQNQSK